MIAAARASRAVVATIAAMMVRKKASVAAKVNLPTSRIATMKTRSRAVHAASRVKMRMAQLERSMPRSCHRQSQLRMMVMKLRSHAAAVAQ